MNDDNEKKREQKVREVLVCANNHRLREGAASCEKCGSGEVRRLQERQVRD